MLHITPVNPNVLSTDLEVLSGYCVSDVDLHFSVGGHDIEIVDNWPHLLLVMIEMLS